MSFLQRLRDLDARAAPGPWEWRSNHDGYPTEMEALGVGVLRPGIAVSPGDGGLSAYITNDSGSAEPEHPDFAIIPFLRSAAPRIAALVEAADAILRRNTCAIIDPSKCVDPAEWIGVCVKEFDALSAALTALDTEPT